MKVRVVAYDPAWRVEFPLEAERIAAGLGELVVALHHIGSTAVPGLHAKPVIDILLEVTDVDRLDERAAALERLGYEALGELGIPGRRYFRRDDSAGVRTHQVHGFRAGDAGVVRHIAFRDFMLAHPHEARRYGALKQALARAYPDDIEAYMDGKDPHVRAWEAQALAWRGR